MEITEAKFKESVGVDPIQDDLERCNCNIRGAMHTHCGWDSDRDMPVFIPGKSKADNGLGLDMHQDECVNALQAKVNRLKREVDRLTSILTSNSNSNPSNATATLASKEAL